MNRARFSDKPNTGTLRTVGLARSAAASLDATRLRKRQDEQTRLKQLLPGTLLYKAALKDRKKS
ncbi:hypothetical protein ACVWYQ_003521 [Bradyrhizobium sp. USDA 3397]